MGQGQDEVRVEFSLHLIRCIAYAMLSLLLMFCVKVSGLAGASTVGRHEDGAPGGGAAARVPHHQGADGVTASHCTALC